MNLTDRLSKVEEELAECKRLLEEKSSATYEAVKGRDEVKRVFPEEGFRLDSGGWTWTVGVTDADSQIQGNMFYSYNEGDKEAKRRQAEVRVREAINKANDGVNGFIGGGTNNYHIFYDTTGKDLNSHLSQYFIDLNPWEYIRSQGAVESLIEDGGFCKDWLLMKGISYED